mmetsp:Transcript_30528/g.79453  ORF Transcript_30528/g.79453 Transcript_30528/m.79453 type:complete len:207 (+) Transcript_30528:122-742(+)
MRTLSGVVGLSAALKPGCGLETLRVTAVTADAVTVRPHLRLTSTRYPPPPPPPLPTLDACARISHRAASEPHFPQGGAGRIAPWRSGWVRTGARRGTSCGGRGPSRAGAAAHTRQTSGSPCSRRCSRACTCRPSGRPAQRPHPSRRSADSRAAGGWRARRRGRRGTAAPGTAAPPPPAHTRTRRRLAPRRARGAAPPASSSSRRQG